MLPDDSVTLRRTPFQLSGGAAGDHRRRRLTCSAISKFIGLLLTQQQHP